MELPVGAKGSLQHRAAVELALDWRNRQSKEPAVRLPLDFPKRRAEAEP